MSNDRPLKVFLVDDDVKTLIMLKSQLSKKIDHDIDINIFVYGENSLDRMDKNPDIVVLDYYLDGIKEDAENGLEILKKIKAISPNTQIIMLSSQEDMETALEAIRAGAYDYIIKGEKGIDRLILTLNRLILDYKKQLKEVF